MGGDGNIRVKVGYGEDEFLCETKNLHVRDYQNYSTKLDCI